MSTAVNTEKVHPLYEALRDELVARRKQLGWSMQRLATEMNVSWVQVQTLEQKTVNPGFHMVIRWADALQVDLAITFKRRGNSAQ